MRLVEFVDTKHLYDSIAQTVILQTADLDNEMDRELTY